jgi:hypothetical protein
MSAGLLIFNSIMFGNTKEQKGTLFGSNLMLYTDNTGPNDI